MKTTSDMILDVRHVSKSFALGRGSVPVLKDIVLSVGAGETVALMGASGAGKSTLLHIIGGLERPTTGSVVFDGVDIYGIPGCRRTALRSRRVGFVFQFYHLLPELDVLENVMLPAMNRPPFSRARGDLERAMSLLGAVGLAERAFHLPAELSGGEQQRTALARALMNEPDLLLADEPTGNLDLAMGESVLDCLCALCRDKGSTLIMATHNPRVAGRCGRVMKLENGCLAFS